MGDQAEQLRRRMDDSATSGAGHWTRFVTWESVRFVESADTATGRVAELPAAVYREERPALGALFSKGVTTSHAACATAGS